MNCPADSVDASSRVLIVEDEPRLRQMLGQMMVELGYRATAVESGEKALATMRADPHAIVLLDLNLPGMDGLSCLERIRQRWPTVQALILTGFGDLEAARRAIHLDVVDFLTKPTRMVALEAALARAQQRIVDAQSPAVDPRALDEDGDRPNHADRRSLQDLERQHILEALARHDGNRQKAAAELGISLRKLYYRLAEYQKQGHLCDEPRP
jgi:DNA-binding NtrC family response regulator